MTGDSPRLRLAIVGVIVIGLFSALFARLWFLQVLASETYRIEAEGNRVRFIQEQAPRGRILDRNGKVIVGNRISIIVTVDRKRLAESGDRKDVVNRLAAVLAKPVKEIEERLKDQRYSPYQPVPVAEDVNETAIVYIKEHGDEFPAVDVRRVAVRDYPYGPLAAHILGYVGEINDEELTPRKKDGYELGDSIGKSGVERVYENDLRGKPSLEKLEVDSEGDVLRSLGKEQPVAGNDIQLTIDIDVQALAERALAEQLERARHRRSSETGKNFPAPAGSVVVMNPQNGEVVAMASNPTYDPRQFLNGISTQAFAVLNDPNNHFPLNNRAIQGQYAPGSTFKLISSVAGLRAGVITPVSPFVDNGGLQIGNRFFRNAGSARHGTVTLPSALTVSSDAYYYNIGNQLWEQRGTHGEDALQRTAMDFGFAAETGVPLTSEQDGTLLTPASKAKLYEESEGKAVLDPGWFAGDNANLAIGQGLLAVTPLQLANSYSAVANGGKLMSPNIAMKVVTPKGRVVRELPPRVIRQLDLPPEFREPIVQGLVGVTANGKGTAAGVFAGFPLDIFPIAGKTGTAQVSGGRDDTGLFASFGPAFNPQWTIVAILEEVGFGSNSAAPVTRQLWDALAGVAPLTPAQEVAPVTGLPPGSPVAEPPPVAPGGAEAPPDTVPDGTVHE